MVATYRLRYTAIVVADLDRSVAFYENILGMKLAARVKAPETKGEFAIMRSEGSEHWLDINWYADHQYQPGDALDHVAFEVEDLARLWQI